jgi:hypothetical protein
MVLGPFMGIKDDVCFGLDMMVLVGISTLAANTTTSMANPIRLNRNIQGLRCSKLLQGIHGIVTGPA